ncbi:hypothetical protein BV22DRAFT_1015411 [Leucogyrophana mollusca]|uniref:Uncharacterized protein n=1 Tax=Leucogyrophana mollusca TaxID=85980 RepID=A0ACB8BG19_9AGAM|nr:hypothetical protein BV22DRAFT_1015411 [Leucogyrophana mollusca]
MSSGGTQSPPLEATGEHIPMGVSSIDGSCSKPTRDVDQRSGVLDFFQPVGINGSASILQRTSTML